MAKYPTRESIRAEFSDEALDAMIPDLPSYLTTPVTLASLAMEEITPQIITAWGDLAEAIRQYNPTVVIKPTEIGRPKNLDELRDAVVGRIAAERYDAEVKAEKEAE